MEAFYHAKSIIKMNEGNEGTEKTLKWWNEKRKKKQMKGFRNLILKKQMRQRQNHLINSFWNHNHNIIVPTLQVVAYIRYIWNFEISILHIVSSMGTFVPKKLWVDNFFYIKYTANTLHWDTYINLVYTVFSWLIPAHQLFPHTNNSRKNWRKQICL